MKIDEIIKLVSKTKLYTLEPGSEVEISIYVPKPCHEEIDGFLYTERIEHIFSKATYLGIHNKDNELDTLKNCLETCGKDNVEVFDIHLDIEDSYFANRVYFAWPDMMTKDEVELFYSCRCRHNTSDFKMKIK